MGNNFKSGVEQTRKNIELVKAAKAAKEIKQYAGSDVYKLMKDGNMFAIVVDGVVIGGAKNEKDAEAAVEFLTHFTGGKPLTKETLYGAGSKALSALHHAHELVEAEKEGITINQTYTINGRDYVIDETNELYTVDGQHICNVADIVEAKKSGGLSEELFVEILKSRIYR